MCEKPKEQEEFSKEDIVNFQLRYPIVVDEIRFIKSQIWAITNYSLLIFGLNIWVYDKFCNLKGSKHWVTLFCVVFNAFILLMGCWFHHRFRESLDDYRDRSDEIEKIIKIKYLDKKEGLNKRSYWIEKILITVIIIGFLISTAYIIFKSLKMI